MKKIKLALIGLFTILTSTMSYAYLDPGTGGYLIQSSGPIIWTWILTAFTFIGGFIVRFFWAPIKGFFRKLKKKGESNGRK